MQVQAVYRVALAVTYIRAEHCSTPSVFHIVLREGGGVVGHVAGLPIMGNEASETGKYRSADVCW